MKLRLLLSQKCNRSCAGCCNKDWDLNSLPLYRPGDLPLSPHHVDYEEVLLTGGEPMLDPNQIIDVAKYIKAVSDARIYLYTAKVDNLEQIEMVLPYIDGMTVTLHERSDVELFHKLDSFLVNNEYYGRSYRLNIFKDVLPSPLSYSPLWVIKKDIVWIKNCPLPKDEEFRQIN